MKSRPFLRAQGFDPTDRKVIGQMFRMTSLLATCRPELLHLPTTNGEHCTGDLIKMGEAIGAITIDIE